MQGEVCHVPIDGLVWPASSLRAGHPSTHTYSTSLDPKADVFASSVHDSRMEVLDSGVPLTCLEAREIVAAQRMTRFPGLVSPRTALDEIQALFYFKPNYSLVTSVYANDTEAAKAAVMRFMHRCSTVCPWLSATELFQLVDLQIPPPPPATYGQPNNGASSPGASTSRMMLAVYQAVPDFDVNCLAWLRMFAAASGGGSDANSSDVPVDDDGERRRVDMTHRGWLDLARRSASTEAVCEQAAGAVVAEMSALWLASS